MVLSSFLRIAVNSAEFTTAELKKTRDVGWDVWLTRSFREGERDLASAGCLRDKPHKYLQRFPGPHGGVLLALGGVVSIWNHSPHSPPPRGHIGVDSASGIQLESKLASRFRTGLVWAQLGGWAAGPSADTRGVGSCSGQF